MFAHFVHVPVKARTSMYSEYLIVNCDIFAC